ncbi:MAG TPA: DHA2 family efflux MFS transporter permease subunit [Nocardioidaceae bacterium]|nr:DHA2 family efflux MFS transporter permease subunit [Nocardioidaceae bacterium]
MGYPAIGTQAQRRRWMSLALVVTAQFMVILDVTIVNVALPSIQRDLGLAQENLQWVITAYTIMFGAALLLGGRLADLLGRRRLLLGGLALFSVSSLLCGLAWSEGSLIAFRAAQGLGAALLVPAALALLMSIFAEGPERNLALGIYGAVSGGGAAVGVLLGGLLTTYLSWPWIFFVNVPVGIGAIALTPLLLRESRAVLPHRHFDLAGASSVTAGLMLLVYALTRATSDGWGATTTLCLLATSAALLLAFVAIELRSGAPLLPQRLFRLRTLSAANATMAVVGAGAFSEFFLLTLYMQNVLRFSPVETGAAFVALALAAIVASNVVQAVVGRVGVRPVLTGGLLALALSAALLGRVPVDGHYFPDLFPPLLIGGAGLGVSLVAATIGSLTGVGPSDSGIASGLVNTSRQIGGAIGLAAIGAVAAASSSSYVDSHADVTASSARALTHGFQTGFSVLTGVLLLGALIAATLVKPRPASAEPDRPHDQTASEAAFG